MITTNQLKKVVKEGLNLVKSDKSLLEATVYASANRRTVGRVVYTTHIPSNGLEEPKSDEDFGISVEIWFKKGGKKLLGFGQEPSDISLEAVKRALEKAKRDAVEDEDFHGFLKKKGLPKEKSKKTYHDQALMILGPKEEAETLAKISWETIQGAVDTIAEYAKKKKLDPQKLAFILNGDNFIVREKMALATTGGIFNSDETTVVLSFLTAMLEEANSKGSSWGARLTLDNNFSPYYIGREATLSAINGVEGVRIPTGKYDVIFSHQAVTDLFGSLLLSHLNLGMIEFGASMFGGKYGQKVASELLTLYDDATLPGGAGTKKITCEGCPTGKTMLINQGRLVGFLSDNKTTSKVLGKAEWAKQMLGVDPHEIRHAITPRNGFRFAGGGGRIAASPVGIHATNLVVTSPKPFESSNLLKKVKDGIFIGRLWYTYPVGGYSSGIITGTAVADSYLVKNGKLTKPIEPNSLRLEDNLGEMIKNIIGIGSNPKPTILWASDEITHAPWVAIKNVKFFSIGK